MFYSSSVHRPWYLPEAFFVPGISKFSFQTKGLLARFPLIAPIMVLCESLSSFCLLLTMAWTSFLLVMTMVVVIKTIYLVIS